MSLRIIEVVGKLDLDRYIRLPSVLPDRRPNYVPPIWSDERTFHDSAKNPDLRACDVVRYLAWSDGRAVGRIMGIVHHPYNALHGERTARFYQLDCVNGPTVASALLKAVERWAIEQGMDRIIGPFGTSDKDPQGLQVEGFEHLPVLATPSNPAYLPGLVEAEDYTKLMDAVVYQLAIPNELPAVYVRISDRLLNSGRFRLLSFTSKRQLKPWIVPVLRLVNDTYQDLLGFVPMDEAGMRKLAGQYLPVLDAAFVKVVVDEQDLPVAFVVAMPDMSAGIQRAKGKLLPLGWWYIMQAMRRSKQLDLFLGAVRRDLQGRGLTGVLAVHLMAEARKRGFTVMDSHLVLETNLRMRAELERLGGAIRKRYRIYQKAIQA